MIQTQSLSDMKVCFKCGGDPQPLSNFYKHKGMADGHLNKCKECTKKDVHQRYDENPDKIREYEKKRSQKPKRKEDQKRIRNTDKFKQNLRRYKQEYKKRDYYPEQIYKKTKRFREKYPEKYKAHNIVNNAVRDGKLKKEPCYICGDLQSQAHHKDYSKPLEVIWVCDKHHKEIHINKEEVNAT